jgi:hypothetical protein
VNIMDRIVMGEAIGKGGINMVTGDHGKGFEKEAKLMEIYLNVQAVQELLYQWADFKDVAKLINPELCEGVYKRRPCKRKLRYIGYDNWPETIRYEMIQNPEKYFVHGEIYNSTEFNGATYSIQGYSETGKVIGCAYFKWLKED